MPRLLVLHLEESRWKGKIELPNYLKFLRYSPLDSSLLDMSSFLDNDSNSNQPEYALNYKCEVIVNNSIWPHVLQSIISGHEALQNTKIRVWVLKNYKKWDQVPLSVNYCSQLPPLTLYSDNSCFNMLQQLDNIKDMHEFWSSNNTVFYDHIIRI